MKKTTIVPAGEVRRSVRDGQYITHIPLQFRKRGAQKVLIPPPGEDMARTRSADSPLLLALGRAFYWQRLLDEQEYESADALATGLGIDRTVVKETLRFTLLAPDIVQAVLEGKQPSTFTLQTLKRRVPMDWEEQRVLWGFAPVK